MGLVLTANGSGQVACPYTVGEKYRVADRYLDLYPTLTVREKRERIPMGSTAKVKFVNCWFATMEFMFPGQAAGTYGYKYKVLNKDYSCQKESLVLIEDSAPAEV